MDNFFYAFGVASLLYWACVVVSKTISWFRWATKLIKENEDDKMGIYRRLTKLEGPGMVVWDKEKRRE
jgi:hypothetical protein